MNNMWMDYGDKEGWGILLVDARNTFKEVNQMALLWHVQHIWPSGSRYTFDTYCHWKILVVRNGTNLYIKEGVTQGDPLAMVLYALGVLPIIEHLEQYCKDDTTNLCLLFLIQIWYADDSAFAGYFAKVWKWFKELCKIGPPLGYFPEPDKSILSPAPRTWQTRRIFQA
mmetsp:Transcript_5227/g.7776  ORF Transcript_5227/g.7776 Transcript_5227/m.7776 type:complete len:169 (+) Transcript_5227:2704-3210(+)